MNVYFIGICAVMCVFLVVSNLVSRKIKDANDFYVAGRGAPLLLIVGSMVASFTSTGMFMGDAAKAYEGALVPMLMYAGMPSAGYMLGAVFFGRYLRRSGATTVPEFFGLRFCSNKVRVVSAITSIIMMTVYLLSVIQGVGTLMSLVTGVSYNVCVTLALIVFTYITVVSGSKGVLITDTLMSLLFTISLLLSVIFVSHSCGGWFQAISSLASNPETRPLLSWQGKPGVLYDTGWENIVWGLSYGVVWMSVCAVAPWQASRYLMAKDEHTVMRSAPIAALGVFVLEFFICTTAVIINIFHPNMSDSSHVWIWTAMNVLPKFLGVFLITGVLSAGISSATTFLSLIGASVTHDILPLKSKNSICFGRFVMIIVSVIILALAVTNPPAVFFIMILGGASAASSWMPVAVGAIFSKRMTRTGALLGMSFGMLGCFVASLLKDVVGIRMPAWLDPAIIGIFCNIIAIVIGSVFTKVSQEEKITRDNMFKIPEQEKNEAEIKTTKKITKFSLFAGLIMTSVLLIFWVFPYFRGVFFSN